jgi:hypothetical protein
MVLLPQKIQLFTDRPARTFSCAGIGSGSLTAYRQASPVPKTPVTTEIHQPLDIHGHFSPEIAFHDKLGHLLTDALDLIFAELPDPLRRFNPHLVTDQSCTRSSYAINRRERNHKVLMIGNVNPRNSCHLKYLQTLRNRTIAEREILTSFWMRTKSLTLTLLMARVLANDSHCPLSFQDLAIPTDFLNRSAYFHLFISLL